MIMTITSLACILAIILLASERKGELVSCLSEGWYWLGMLHYFLLMTSACTLMPHMLMVTPSQYSALAFATCSMLTFVATAPDYKGWEKSVHEASAFLCAVCACVWTFLMNPWCLILGIPFLVLSIVDRDRWLLWLELSAFSITYTTMIIIDLWN